MSSFKAIMFSIAVLVAGGCNHENPSDGEREIYINHYKSECQGLELASCLLSKSTVKDNWSLFYEPIEGFDYEWGYVYKLRVNISNIEIPPEDASSTKYTLVEILSKELESSATTFDIAASRASGIVVIKNAGIYELYGEKKFSCATQECASIESLITQDLAILFEFTHNATPSEPMQLIQVKCSASRESFNVSCL